MTNGDERQIATQKKLAMTRSKAGCHARAVPVSQEAGFRSGTRPTKERIPVGRNETALHLYSHSQPLRAHSDIVLKINIFHVEKADRHAKEARDDGFKSDRHAKELAMTDSIQIATQKRLAMTLTPSLRTPVRT